MTRAAQITTCTLAALGLSVLLACGGGSSNNNSVGGGTTTAASLTYTDPTGTGFKLVRDATHSTASHLILKLVGPTSTELSGVGFFLTADASKAKWAVVSGGKRIGNTAFSTTLIQSKVTGDELQAGIYQKGNVPAITTNAATVLATVALDLQTNVAPGAITITAPAGKAVTLNKPGSATPTTPIAIAVGTLMAN